MEMPKIITDKQILEHNRLKPSKSLKGNSSLEELNISYDKGIKKLTEVIQLNSTLLNIYVASWRTPIKY